MLYIMRHGRTDWNMAHRLQGSEDIPLNEEGRQMARDAREKYCDLHFDICYCSPLQRAHETAEIPAEGKFSSFLYLYDPDVASHLVSDMAAYGTSADIRV